jgi:hypothetical protein
LVKKILVLLIAVFCVMGLVTTIYAEDLIKNGNYDSGSDNWVWWAGNGGDATPAVENGEAKIKVSNVGSETWSVQWRQEKTGLVKGKSYIVKFDARSSAPRKIQVILEHSGGSYTKYYGPKDFDITTDMATYTCEFTMEESDDPDAHLVFCLGAVGRIGKPHFVYFDNVSLTVK